MVCTTSERLTNNQQVGRDGTIFSYGNSFYSGDIPTAPSMSKRDTIEPVVAFKSAVSTLDLPVEVASATSEPKEAANTFAIKQSAVPCLSQKHVLSTCRLTESLR
jgi:extracellular elastinolytic metalloproteinase